MATMSQLRYSPLNRHYHTPDRRQISAHKPNVSAVSFPSSSPQNLSFCPLQANILNPNLLQKFQLSFAGGNGSDGVGYGGGGGGGSGGDSGGWSEGGGGDSDHSSSSSSGLGIIGLFLNGWRSRVAADPQFPFKVLMEELVGVSACVLGDMLSRPNFGLNELDFVFSTLIVGSILNFTLDVYVGTHHVFFCIQSPCHLRQLSQGSHV
ncbi:hypothetical protein L1049_008339 [Liquidambar formosana]|uniref:Uncharacterized protein n=1 Tax=Liquidambar formosana TaxID=63359 RepID=A0AAP0S6A6_LIQFO